MSILIKAGAGLFAGFVAGGLGFLFWPHVDPGVAPSRSAVEKPVFVVANAPTKAATPPAPAIAAPATQIAEKIGVEKLAAALKQDTKPAADVKPALEAKGLGAPPAANEEAAKLFAQGLVALAEGDVAAARLYLLRASDAGDARALMALGDSYDAATLARLGVVGAKGDAAKARDFYARALNAGVGAAKDRIAAIEAKAN